jgi:hypothetical protein
LHCLQPYLVWKFIGNYYFRRIHNISLNRDLNIFSAKIQSFKSVFLVMDFAELYFICLFAKYENLLFHIFFSFSKEIHAQNSFEVCG